MTCELLNVFIFDAPDTKIHYCFPIDPSLYMYKPQRRDLIYIQSKYDNAENVV